MSDSIFDEGYRFEFFQAVRILEALYPEKERVGDSSNPQNEAVRFHARLSLAFPASEIYEISPGGENSPASMTVNFMGLTGPLGILPHPYTEYLLSRVHENDHAARDFLDIFNHRLISLFYRAWQKYHLPALYGESGRDRLSEYLLALIGMGTPGLQGRLAVREYALLLYAGLLAQRPHSTAALTAILTHYFSVPMECEQFVGYWVTVETENQSRLGKQNCRLGLDTLCGDRIWDRQSKFRLRVGPLGLDAFNRFLPGGADYEPLMQLTRFIAGSEHEFDAQLVLRAEEVPSCRLCSASGAGSQLGWSSWLKTHDFICDSDGTIVACNN
jgi:type VI secretion system protein ImpH